MKKPLLVLATLAFIITILLTTTSQLSFSSLPPNHEGSIIDVDNDGLADNKEHALGTDPANPDTDSDGLIDGGDPDILNYFIDSLEDSALKKGEKGLRKAIAARLNNIEKKFINGKIDKAITDLETLGMRFDGCPHQPDNNDWVISCGDQIQVQEIIDTIIANHFSFTIDPTVVPLVYEIPGLSGGPSRSVATAIGPGGAAESFVANEIIIRISNLTELSEILDTYSGAILRDGTPLLVEGEIPNPNLPSSTGFYLVRVDPAMSELDDFAPNMEAAGLRGNWRFSSEDAARVTALVARDIANRKISLNQITDVDFCAVCEHPDDGGGNIDAAMWPWMTEDDNPATPKIDGLSVGTIRAWEYLRYQGFPPKTSYYPTKVAVVDGGFDLDQHTGVPLFGDEDFFYFGSKPPQLDEIDYDGTAGGIAKGFANCPDGCWHGHDSFGVCCANGRNHFGTAGTSGGGTTGARIQTLLIRVGPDVYNIASGIYDAAYNNADVINISIGFDCDWLCRTFDNGNILKAYVGNAHVDGSVVVASAGNNHDNIDDNNIYPCELDGAICVGAVDSDGMAMDYSNYGSVVDMWAPTNIKSTLNRESARHDANNTGEDELAVHTGTSCAAPFLAGIVALMKTLNPYLYKDQVLAKLQDSANDSTDSKVNPGYVDALLAVQEVKPNQPPIINITSHNDGDITRYKNVYLGGAVNDPEKDGPWGDEFENSVTISSDRQGELCTDTSIYPPYGCYVSTLSIGPHTITATATDAFGATDKAKVTIYVVNTQPTATITYPPTSSNYYKNQTINFSGYGFDPDEEIGANDLAWHSNINGSLGNGPTLSTQLDAGDHTITLTVTDELGATGTDMIAISVIAGEGHPSAQIISPADGTLFQKGDQVTLRGKGTDPEDGSLTGSSLTWASNIDGDLEGSGEEITVSLSCGPCGFTEHIITLTVTDSDDNTARHSIRVVVGRVC